MAKRKIPARKHHGIRDPAKQQQQQFQKIKNKINNPPEKHDAQKVPNRLAQLINLKSAVKHGKKFKVKRFIDNEDKPKNAGKSKVRPIRKLTHETDEDYLKRVNRITTQTQKEVEYEIKYGVDVQRNSAGEITIKKKPKDELEELAKKNHKSRFKKKIEKPKIDKKITKELIKQVLEEEKSNKKPEIEEYKKDVFKFGEIVHGPPTLTIPRKARKNETVPRPGMKNNLLLKSILHVQEQEQPSQNDEKSNSKKSSCSGKSVDLKGKRKDLSISQRQMIENEQNKVIELYRKIKKDKLKSI